MTLEQRERRIAIGMELTMAALTLLLVIILLAKHDPGRASSGPVKLETPTFTPAAAGAAPFSALELRPLATPGSGQPAPFENNVSGVCAILTCPQPEGTASGLAGAWAESSPR